MNPTQPMPCTDYIRELVTKLLGRPPEDQDLDVIFKFYERMRDNPELNPEAFDSPKRVGSKLLPALWLFHSALERNRYSDARAKSLQFARYLGLELDRYELKFRIGSGGFGEVYYAASRHPGRMPDRVAIKVIPFDQSARPKFKAEERSELRKRAVNEAKELQRIQITKNIVRFYGALDDPKSECVFIKTEYIDGCSLGSLIDWQEEGPLPICEAIELAIQACNGLSVMHDLKIIHRDVKPLNLILDTAGCLKVADLGLAGPDDPWRSDRITRAGMSPGWTRGYTPPEQALGQNIGPQADVYGLGWTLYDLICPPSAVIWDDDILKNFRSPPDAAHEAWKSLPAGLAAVIAQAVAYKPEDRFPTIDDFRSALVPFGPNSLLEKTLERLGKIKTYEDIVVDIWVGEDLAAHHSSAKLIDSANIKHHKPGLKWKHALIIAPITLAIVLMLYRTIIPKEKPHELMNIIMRTMEVKHWVKNPGGDYDRDWKVLGRESFATHQEDAVKVGFSLSRPAYCYIIAFRPDGTERVCFPLDPDAKPTETDHPSYPYPITEAEGYGLDEGIGLQVFYLVASQETLPSFAEWRRALGPSPWRTTTAVAGKVWRFDGVDLTEFSPDHPYAYGGSGLSREAGRPLPRGGQKLVELARWLSQDRKIEVLTGIGFAVSKK